MCLHEYLHDAEINLEFFQGFVRQKFGYGNWDNTYWFVGPEEGGGGDCVELALRLQAWQQHLEQQPEEMEFRNLQMYHAAIGVDQFHAPNPQPQRTWIELIGVLGSNGHGGPGNGPPMWIPPHNAVADGQAAPLNWKRRFQRDFLGQNQPDGHEVAVLEVSPLASPSKDCWLWRCLEEPINGLNFGSREEFLQSHIGEPPQPLVLYRLRQIHDQMQMQKPYFVLFYGGSIMGVQAVKQMAQCFQLMPPNAGVPVQYGNHHGTPVFWSYHPRWFHGHFREAVQAVMENHIAPWNEGDGA